MSHLTSLIEKHRHINVDYDDWYLPCYESFIEKLDSLGIDTTRSDINFSGFWSQGDGASFTGYIHRDNMLKFIDEHVLGESFPAATYFATRKELGAKLVRSGSHYVHENTVQVDINTDYIEAQAWEEDDPRREIYVAMEEAFNKEFSEFEEKVQTICRGWMQILYRQLEDEYEALTSDECVLDTLKANDMIPTNLITEGEEDGLCSNQR